MVWRVCKSTRQIFLLWVFFYFLSNQVTVHCNSEMVKNGMRIFMPFRCSNIRCQGVAYFDIQAQGINGICLFLSTERQYGRFSVVMLVPWYQRWTNCLCLWKNVFLICLQRERLLHTRCTCFFIFILLLYAYALLLWVKFIGVSWVNNDVSKSLPHKPKPFRYLSMGVWVTNNQVQIRMYVNKISFT